jgi:hypothetical protein
VKWVDDLVPDHLEARPDLQVVALRKQVRYWLFRLKTEADGGPKAVGVPRGLRAYFKKAEWFDGWENFGVTWDVESDDPTTTRPRYESIHEEWDHKIDGIVREQTRGIRQRQRAGNGSKGHV